jgi:molybdopterin/thiamine biosynthesis adenylyltransferase
MHLLQVGAGSGGMAVLDLVARDPRISRVTLVEPDVYKPHNVHRHLFPPSSVGRLKAELAAEWVRAIRPDLVFEGIVADITDPARQAEFARLAAECDIGVCAADNEPAKFAFDALLRAANKPWTLGEVLSGGIGGWVHKFTPGGACYGCVASHLQREVVEQPAGPPPDYSNPSAAQPEATIPATKASIAVIAGLHALVTLEELTAGINPAARPESDFTSLLFSLQPVPGVFETAFRPHRLRIPRSPTCLTCGTPAPTPTGEQLDAAVDDALARLGAR